MTKPVKKSTHRVPISISALRPPSLPKSKKACGSGHESLSVKLDDSSFPAPIYATLIKIDGEKGKIRALNRR